MRLLIIGGCGYIGSALYNWLSAAGHAVSSIDLEWRGNSGRIRNVRRDYRDLHAYSFDRCDAVIWVAGHSTVSRCEKEPLAAFDNNVSGLLQLAAKLKGQKLIYASSGSVYGAAIRAEFRNMYDMSKFTADNAMPFVYPNYYALRFGTVCGPSPNMRFDTMLNGMTRDAIEKRAIQVWNAAAHRPLLGISDLCRIVTQIATTDQKPGIYNLASVETTIGDLAAEISCFTGAVIATVPVSGGYDFTMDAFDFEYRETIQSMVTDIINQLSLAKTAA